MRRQIVEKIRSVLIKKALKEQGVLSYWYKLCEKHVPDLSDQYTGCIMTPYKQLNVRAMHAFQMSLFYDWWHSEDSLRLDLVRVADFGDSSGNHCIYLNKMYGGHIRTASYNIDPIAIGKIRKKGLNACLLERDNLDPLMTYDCVTIWQVMEHLEDPLGVLRRIDAPYIVGSVPYVKNSRVGLHSLRKGKEIGSPEEEHLFELSPEDWTLLFRYAGWELVEQKTYLQYPKYLPFFRFLYYNDYDGFWGFILRRTKNGIK